MALWLVAINPHSGNGRGSTVAARVKSILHQKYVAFHAIAAENAVDLSRQLASELDSKKYSGVIAVGGDGLAHLVMQVTVPRQIAFAIIPAGTGNDFVRSLGWSLENVEPLLDRVISSSPSPIDLGNVDSEWFGAILSTGFDSVVNERANQLTWPMGPQRYNVAIAMELARFKPIQYEITCDGVTMVTEAMLVAVGNGKSYGGGMNVCPTAQMHDGLFDIVILEPVSKFEFLRVFPKVYSGSHLSHPAVKTLRAKKVTISADAVAYADGERIGPAPVSAECIKDAGLTWIL
ncbi:LCB5 Sphingosine kinase and enzymes related to eukaryotic diacylglycerol kinase [Candidatus Nanopelagicaceae bacterium]